MKIILLIQVLLLTYFYLIILISTNFTMYPLFVSFIKSISLQKLEKIFIISYDVTILIPIKNTENN